MLERAFRTFKATKDRPTLIIVDSHIGYGAPTKEGTAAAHGEPLGEDEIRATKRFYGWPEDAKFQVPDAVPAHFARAARRAWQTPARRVDRRASSATARTTRELAEALYRMQRRQLPEGWDKDLPSFEADEKGVAGRDASGKVLNVLAQNVPWLVGGSADLAPSTKTRLTFDGGGRFSSATPGGRNFHFGVREHAMASVLERPQPVQGAAVRLGLFGLQRLRAARDSA